MGEIDEESGPRLYLVGSPDLAVGGTIDALDGVLQGSEPAAFLLPSAWARDRSVAQELRRRVADRNTAFFVEGDLGLVDELAADGLHLLDPAAMQETRRRLKEDRILGADVRLSRHDAMEAGEGGADYVAFGDWGRGVDQELVDLIGWWRDLFVLPCLAYASSWEDVTRLAKGGADFIAVRDLVWNADEGAEAAACRLRDAMGEN